MNHPFGFRSRLFAVLVAASSLALSCAGPNKLAQQSEKAYGQGDLEEVFLKLARESRSGQKDLA